MKHWMKKAAAVLITVVTLGAYVPPVHFDTEAEENKEEVSSNTAIRETIPDVQTEDPDLASLSLENDLEDDDVSVEKDYFLQEMTEKAKEQTIAKLGPRISEQ